MKRKLLAFAILLAGAIASHAENQKADFTNIGNFGTICVATDAWTAIPSTATIWRSRTSLMVGPAETNYGNFLVAISSNDLRPGTTTQGFTMRPNINPWILPVGGYLRVWGISDSTTCQNVQWQEFSQQPLQN